MRSSARRISCLTLALASLPVLAGSHVKGAEVNSTAEPRVDFEREIRPILTTRCHTCHGSTQQMNGLRLDRREDALEGGLSGPAIVPGSSSQSRLIQLVAGVEKNRIMPPAGDRLSDQEIGRLRAWIDQGAQWPEGRVPAEATDASGQATGHWAFQALRRPEQPSVRYQGWVRNTIDTFVLARLESEGIELSPEADRVTLYRRASLDLTGLPPSPEESSEFLADKGSRAYEKLLDRLLASEHYGEKWARHWLDQARYADSDGYEKDNPRPHAWRYRHLGNQCPESRHALRSVHD